MNKSMKLTTFGFVSALMLVIAVPMTAQAGTLTIHNKNCTKTAGFIKKQRVTVHVFSKNSDDGCTNEWVTVHKGDSRTIEILAKDEKGKNCSKYTHEATGTVFNDYDISGYRDSSVTCKKDWAKICQCTKD